MNDTTTAGPATDPDGHRDWAVLAMVNHFINTDCRETAEEVAAQAPHMIAVSRAPGGEWEPTLTSGEPARWAFLVEGELTCGTLADFAKYWEAAHYSGGHMSLEVRTWSGAEFKVRCEYLGADEDLFMRYRLSVGAETVFVTLDGRA